MSLEEPQLKKSRNDTDASELGRAHTAMDEVKDGAFVRTESVFRDKISNEPGAKYPAESGRYHLYVSYAVSCFRLSQPSK